MAKKSVRKKGAGDGSSKAQAIRDEFVAMNKKARPRDIITRLAEKGIVVSSAQVSMTLKAMGARPRRRGRPAKNGRSAGAKGNHNVSMADLLAAKEFADRLGGVSAAKETLELLTQLR